MLMNHNFINLNVKHAMRANFMICHNFAVQMRQCAVNLPLTVRAALPNVLRETFFGSQFGHASEMLCHILLILRQNVHTQHAVCLQNRVDLGLAIDAQQQRGRLIGQRGHRRHGDAVSPRCAVCGDDVYARRASGHGFTKQ